MYEGNNNNEKRGKCFISIYRLVLRTAKRFLRTSAEAITIRLEWKARPEKKTHSCRSVGRTRGACEERKKQRSIYISQLESVEFGWFTATVRLNRRHFSCVWHCQAMPMQMPINTACSANAPASRTQIQTKRIVRMAFFFFLSFALPFRKICRCARICRLHIAPNMICLQANVSRGGGGGGGGTFAC